MVEKFLYEELDGFSSFGGLNKEMPRYMTENLNPDFELRPYQVEAFARFFRCLANDYPGEKWPLHFLFNMATGSGKTLIMAGIILYLYEKGYRNFLFFVDSTNIIEKTKANFLEPSSAKYLFGANIIIDGKPITISKVINFEGVNQDDINICFTTIQKLHSDLGAEKENALTYEDFKNKRIVLIADEAHHINVSTRRQMELEELTWEDTVEKIFKQNEDNLLLEFTATLDYTHKNIVDKYRNKIIYRYDLKQFRNDGYSKDINIVQSDFADKERILQAIILSQYKQEVAAKHRINLKPVILFKAQKTIAQSQENKANFKKLIENLSAREIDEIKKKSDIPLVQQAFKFFEEQKIGNSQLAARLKVEFDEKRCLSVNEEKEKESMQLLINSLEDEDNPIRAIFAVQKLNEGWDVLNLFDIVRCYEGRDGKGGKPGRTTISEAQLIGRGARYFPFITRQEDDRFRRKFDKELNNELRILEELHYHSVNDVRYISELRTALIEQGMIDEREIQKTLKLKDSFKADKFYRQGSIFLNEKSKRNYSRIRSLRDLGVSRKNFMYRLASGRGGTDALLDETKPEIRKGAVSATDIALRDIGSIIVRNALAKKPFFHFNRLQRYFPNIDSLNDFVESEDYLGGLKITFQGEKSQLGEINSKNRLHSILNLLDVIETDIRGNVTEYEGTKKFKPGDIKVIFFDKELKIRKDSEKADGDEAFVSNKDWYVFNANYGTSEEKAFVRMLDRQIPELKKKYEAVYLIRNERHFKIFSFADGQAFEPDFVLFLKNKSGDMLTYQIFIEPKGKHLREFEKWKEKFLKEITEYFSDRLLEFKSDQKYRVIGVPFYNNEDENQFKQQLFDVLDV